MSNQHTQISEIDDIVFPTVVPTDALGVPIVQEPDNTEAAKPSGFLDDLGDIDDKSSLNNDNPPIEVVEDEPTVTTVETDVEKQTAGKSNASSTVLIQTLKAMYGEDLTIVQENEDGEEVEVSLDDMEIDSETFAEIIRSRTEQEKEEATRDKISIEKASDFTKKLIEISERGGNPTELLKFKEAYLDPLEGLDTDTIEGQKEVLYLYYRAQQRPEDEAKMLIAGFESSGVLSERAEDAEGKIREAVEKQVENTRQAAIKAQEDQKENLKQYRKTLKEVLTKKYEFNDKLVSKLTDSATKVDDTTKKVGIVQRYQEMMADPDMAADLILFLNDKEEYDKQISKRKVLESQIKTAQKIKVVKTSASNVEVRKQQKSDKDNFVPVVIQ
jgi:phosphotransferase system HPr-like phosphotransfer protein